MKKLAQILTIVLLTVSMTSCWDFPIMITGSGPIVSQEFDVASFDKVEATTVIDVEIVQGDSLKVVAEGNENIMNYLDIKVVNNKLRVDLVHGSFGHFDMKVYVTMPTVSEIEIESTGDIYAEGFTGLRSLKVRSSSTGKFTSDGIFEIDGNLDIVSSSTGSITLDANCQDIDARLSSTGSITIGGTCAYQNIDLNSTGNYNAYELLSKECVVETSGTGDAKVNVSDDLDVTIRSVGNVYYKGNPRINIQDSSIGDLIHKD
jgi:hypothetical protein